MKGPIRIFLSYDAADEPVAEELALHLIQALPQAELIFWDASAATDETYRKEATAFLERAQLFVALVSVHYQNTPDVRWEMQHAVEENRRRPGLRVLVALARSAFIPEALKGFTVSPGAADPILQDGIRKDRQMVRVAETARALLSSAPPSPSTAVVLPFELSDLKERLLPLLDRVDFAPIFSALKGIAYDATLLKKLFEAEDSFSNLIQQTRGLKTDLSVFLDRKSYYRGVLEQLIENIREEDLVQHWKRIFIATHFDFQKTQQPALDPYFYIPTEEISVPETLNLPVSIGDKANAENIGLLSFQQKLDFRRSLLLAQDAIAVENYARAHAHGEHVRTHIDPQSAQLYEYLLITYLHKEHSEKIIEEALTGEGRMLNYVTLYAGRLRLYQDSNQCPTRSGAYNRRVVAEILSDGMRSVYDAWPNDYVLDTGKHAEYAAKNQDAARKFIEAAQLVYRAIHPMRGALRILVNELCGGGKFHWVSKIVFADDEIRLLCNERFDLESQIAEIIELIEEVDEGYPDKQYQQRVLLRENLFFSLLAKRQLLARQVAEELRTRVAFTDVHESVIRFVEACLLGQKVFGDASQDGRDQSFLRLALEYLMPNLVISPDPDALLANLRWFDLDASGNLCVHADSRRYAFDARAVIEKIIRDYAGKAGWLQISPNLKSEVFREFVADTEAIYETVKQGLFWTDIRKMNELEARADLIRCLRRWKAAYFAYPEHGQDFLDRIITEISGDGLLQWLYLNPQDLATHPDSLAYGYDARAELREVLALSSRYTENDLRRVIAGHLFRARILPAYDRIRKDNEEQRKTAIQLMLEALGGYRLHNDKIYLDFVYRELTEEIKFSWIDVNIKGNAHNGPYVESYGFDPLAVLDLMKDEDLKRYRPYVARERIADRRCADLTDRYYREISEFRKENRLPEREIVIEVLMKMKGLYLYMPQEKYLELPLRELMGKGRIRWNASFLGLLPTRENHFENKRYDFNYRYELYDCKRLLDNQYEMLQQVMRDTGELQDA